MLKSLNIDPSQSTCVLRLNKFARAYACAQLQPAGAGMLFSFKQRWSMRVIEYRAKRILVSWVQRVRAGLMQTDRPRSGAFNVTTGPHMKEAM